ncbi:MAG: hypothetical protein ICV60_18415 [Pyrinomonadaceae bacterium]|nr:hypothetical protein [Pyrinomonadaceae bacterium]
MSKLRINNATLFVTVLGAVLGLVAAGASSHAHRTGSGVLSEIASVTSATISYGHATNQGGSSFTDAYNSPAWSFASQSENAAAHLLYRNANHLTAVNHILVVTRLPRASLDDLPA